MFSFDTLISKNFFYKCFNMLKELRYIYKATYRFCSFAFLEHFSRICRIWSRHFKKTFWKKWENWSWWVIFTFATTCISYILKLYFHLYRFSTFFLRNFQTLLSINLFWYKDASATNCFKKHTLWQKDDYIWIIL